jgi:outer membrane receptor protein involved in Fe transport
VGHLRPTLTIAAILIFFANSPTFAEPGSTEESDLAAIYGDSDFVSIATGTSQPIARAPAVATVITSSQIRDMGATDLDQVLESVPGLHVAHFYQAYNPIYTIRGIYSDTNPQVLMLINGISITNLYQGNRGQVWGGMPVNDISRIEVIRGPGSALYGADAYAGVINIITKDATDIKGTELGARLGSYNSKDVWLLHGGSYGGIDMTYSLEYGDTDGQHQTIEADAQTGLDAIFTAPPYSAPPASLAPGPVNLGRKYLEGRFDTRWNNWQMRLGYQHRYDLQTGAGVSQALDPVGTNKTSRLNADISYFMKSVKNWDTTFQLSYFDISTQSDLVLFPPGSFAGSYPEGVIGNPDIYERHTQFGISSFYTGWQKHNVRLGLGTNYGDLYKVRETKNFSIAPGGIPVPLGGIVDVSSTAAFLHPVNRTDTYIFAQDEWTYTNDWAVTGGLRYDKYSDFGETVNPRLALVWQTAYNLTSKLLYGQAFRAPSFAELYNINNPVALGNPNLKPETIDTVELAFDYQPIDKIRTSFNVFHYRMSDIIRFLPDPAPATTITAQNTGNQKGYGLEWELNWSLSNSLKFYINYALQHSEDLSTHTDAGNAPHHEIYSNVKWAFENNWSLIPQITYVGERQRVFGDPRPPLKSYTLADMTLRRTQIKDNFEFAASIRNIFDSDAREPTPSPGSIPNDLPLAGRNIYIELSYTN